MRRLDLASFDSVRELAEAVAGDTAHPLTGLVANAGVMACPFELSADGFEMQMATNHLGHALLIALLWPALAPKARVVLISSVAARGRSRRLRPAPTWCLLTRTRARPFTATPSKPTFSSPRS